MGRMKWWVLLLVASTVIAQSTATGEGKSSRKSTAKATARKATGATSEDIQALRALIEQQAQAMQELRQQLQQRDAQMQKLQQSVQQVQAAATEAQSKAVSVESSAAEQKTTVSALQADVKDVKDNFTQTAVQTQEDQKRTSALEGVVSRLRWTGDIRVRQEDFFIDGRQPRIRERIRLRLGLEGALGQDFVGGVAFASGTLTDPTSTNETLSSFFEKKVIGWDRGYITYNPKAHKWLSLTGGKFAYTWVRTPQTFDSDLNPEGFSEKLSFDLKHNHFKNVTVTGVQLLFNENSNTTLGSPGNDSFAAGAQIGTRIAVTKRWTLAPTYMLLNWRNEGVLLNAPAIAGGFTPINGSTNIVCAPVTTLGSTPSCSFAIGPFAVNGLTNSYRITSAASNGNLTRVYNSKFLYSDLILDNTFTTHNPKWPVRVLLEYLDNLRAESPGPGRSPQSHTYLAEFSVGRTANPGEYQFGYAWLRQEQDSVIGSFNESDQRASTNVLQHRLYANYRVHPKVMLQGTAWIGRVLDSSLFYNGVGYTNASGAAATDTLQRGFLAPGITAGQVDKYLKRLQFDIVYSF